jgi:hypothetical protein
MPKVENADIDDLLTPEQVVGSKGFSDLLMLGFPRESYLKITEASNQRGMTFAEALSEAIDDWLKKGI